MGNPAADEGRLRAARRPSGGGKRLRARRMSRSTASRRSALSALTGRKIPSSTITCRRLSSSSAKGVPPSLSNWRRASNSVEGRLLAASTTGPVTVTLTSPSVRVSVMGCPCAKRAAMLTGMGRGACARARSSWRASARRATCMPGFAFASGRRRREAMPPAGISGPE